MELKYIYCLLVIAVGFTTSTADCVLPTDLHGVVVSPSQSTYSPWSRVTLSCAERHSQTGPEYSYCENNKWNPGLNMVTCRAQCMAPVLSFGVVQYTEPGKSKTFYGNGEVIHYACTNTEGATLIGPLQATCEDGQWEPAQYPTCSQCAPPEVSDAKLVRVTPNQESYPAYSSVTLSCVDDLLFSAAGTNTAFCEENGEWLPDPTKMTCREKCPAPDHGSFVQSYPQEGTPADRKTLYEFNEIIVNVCPAEKLLAGPTHQRCVNGLWLPNVAATCQ